MFFSFWATFNSFVIARYSDISVDCNDFEAGFLITYRKILFYTAKINDIWTKMKLIIITIIKHHNSKHYIHSIFINTCI
jgi:hypothetical protein